MKDFSEKIYYAALRLITRCVFSSLARNEKNCCRLLRQQFFWQGRRKQTFRLSQAIVVAYGNAESHHYIILRAFARYAALRLITHCVFSSLARNEKNCRRNKRQQFFWQGRRDSNTQPTVLETATLPLSHSPTNDKIILHYFFVVNVFYTFFQNKAEKAKVAPARTFGLGQ